KPIVTRPTPEIGPSRIKFKTKINRNGKIVWLGAPLHSIDALDVARFGRVDANLITFVDERGNVDDKTGFERGRLHNSAGSGFLECGLGLDDFEVHSIW